MPFLPGCRQRSSEGFFLLEALVAVGLLAVGMIGVAGLLTMAARANRAARETTMCTLLASQKLEQLRSLAWTWDSAGLAVSDRSTDLSGALDADGGVGLTPGGGLAEDVAGYLDYLDEGGAPIDARSSSTRPAYVRRWLIVPLPADPLDSLILQVRVLRLATATRALASSGRPGDVVLVTVRTRVVT